MNMRLQWMSVLVAAGMCVTAVQAQDGKKITLVGGSVGGAWSAVGTAIGETIRRENPGVSFGYEPGREAANIQLVSQGKVQLGIAHAQLAKRAQSGEDPFKVPITNMRGMALIDPQAAVQIIVREDSGIDGFANLKATKKPVRVALNQRGTLMAVVGEEIFKINGMTVKDIEGWGGRILHMDYNAGLEAMKNGQVDMVINMLAFPSGQINSATREMKVRMIGLDQATAQQLGTLLGTAPITIPANTYAFQPAAIDTVRGSVALISASEMTDAEAENIVSGMLKNFDYLKKAHATLGRLEPAALADVSPLQLHPGAAAAYRKAGLIK
ncbi:MAG: TAXI family TRAP transporter solute-binding subunit [Beijerinckiaceae bacterium]